jgi:hypothetical protein
MALSIKNTSDSLSSTISTWRRRTDGVISSEGEREVESRSSSGFRFDPDSSMISLDDSPTNGQTNPSAGVFIVVVKALEEAKYVLLVLGLDANAVVLDGEYAMAILTLPADADLRSSFRAPIFNRVSNEVLKKLLQVCGVNANSGQRFRAYVRARFVYGRGQVGEDILECFV